LLEDLDSRVSLPEIEALAGAVRRHLPERKLLQIFSGLSAGTFGMLDYVIRNSLTLRESFERLVRYHHLNNTIADCAIARQDGVTKISFTQPTSVSPPTQRLLATSWVASCVVIARQLVGDDWTPQQVFVPGQEPSPDDRQAYEDFLRCRFSVASPAALLVAQDADLDRRVQGADLKLATLLQPMLDEALNNVADAGSTTHRVRAALARLCGGQELTLERVAGRLGTSGRTLQRRLQDERTTFQQLLDEVRHEIALVQVTNRAASLDEVAWLLGFSNSTAFHRAFKRWTGVTPGEFRRHA
jgi:AraC-like DNA-binding protein